MSALPIRTVVTIMVSVRSPFLFKGLAGQLFGVDAAALRDPITQAPLLPSDQLRGVLREAVGDLVAAEATISNAKVDAAFVKALFGDESSKETDDGAANEPVRGRVLFADLVAEGMRRDPNDTKSTPLPLPKSSEYTRVEIDDATGAAREGHLQVLELVAPLGATVLFRGEAVVFSGNAAEADCTVAVLQRALALVGSIGSAKSAGLGEVVTVSTATGLGKKLGGQSTPAVKATVPTQAGGVRPERVTVDVLFDRPFLVDAERVADNAFRGSAIVPGAVIKGALAAALTRAGVDVENGTEEVALAGLVVGHAFPHAGDGKLIGRALPRSLVARKLADKTAFADVLDLADGQGALIEGKPALFVGDWKDAWYPAAAKLLGRPTAWPPGDDARTHTAIASARGVAADEQLFTTIARRALIAPNTPWRFRMAFDASGIQDPAAKARALDIIDFALAHGLDGIGKTGAHASFERVEGVAPPSPMALPGKPHRYAIVLETDAMILDANGAIGSDGRWAKSPREAYGAYFAHVLPGSKLHGFFAAQGYAGGYLSRRRRAFGPNAYHPFLLTRAGSVFEIETADAKMLAAFACRGLPVAAQKGAAQLTWRNCPFVPENGFGAVSFDYVAESTPDLVQVTRV
jgi:CRISPR/Cas system CSM-associated protein Csm3 (group 7 of RAMP superfamily)